MIHQLHDGKFFRHVNMLSPKTRETLDVSLLAINPSMGNWISYSKTDLLLQLYTVNGRLVHNKYTTEHVVDMCTTSNFKYLVSAGHKNSITVRLFDTLELVYQVQLSALYSRIISLSLVDDYHLLIATEEKVLLFHTDTHISGEEVILENLQIVRQINV
eukprot:TRINITY_DN14242_c0_g3_i1.p1 TRINITY_DN14242_c0_g3~~TRINITY_DN14242_c0_g3_i1.p1  ORF type:complete len:159 (-),score=21.33 TRINITY_DN14242_c0_g3_i1:135-611(-)